MLNKNHIKSTAPFLVVLSFLLITEAVIAQGNFILKGRVPNDLNGYKIMLTSYGGQNLEKFEDTTVIKNNYFEFKGVLKYRSAKATLSLLNGKERGFRHLVLEPGTINLVSTNTYSKVFFKNKLKTAKLTGPNALVLNDSLEALIDYYYLTFGTQHSGAIDISEEKKKELVFKEIAVIKAFPNEYFSLVQLNDLIGNLYTLDSVEACLNSMSDELKRDPFAVYLKEKINGRRTWNKNSMAPNLALKDTSGNLFDTRSLKGKHFILAFGATWCGPCKQNLPKLKDIYESGKAKGVELVYVNLSDDTTLWKKQILQYGMNWINISEDLPFPQSKAKVPFGVGSIPFYLLVDPTGKIIYNDRIEKDAELKILASKVKSL